MSQVYLEYSFLVKPLSLGNEILIAELGYVGFESFVEDYQGLKAYIQKKEWNKNILEEIQILNSTEFEITYSFNEIEQVNWNAAWEKNFHPIEVDQKCVVRAPFHPQANVDYEIIIEPKMSFGTGHHQTTRLMCSFLLEEDVNSKKVLDMGTGTGILAILSEQLGATSILAVDIEDWSVENTLENAERNACSEIEGRCGDIDSIGEKDYDIVLANINRNILLRHLPSYSEKLTKNGILFLSGFFNSDSEDLKQAAAKEGLSFVDQKSEENWCALKFEKSN